MGYVDSNLMEGERVVHRTRLHKILFLGPVLFAAALLILGYWILPQFNQNFGGVCLAFAIFVMISPVIEYMTSEFAVTNKRVIVKAGLIRRHTMETLLQKIEAVGVNQSILGRILSYGTIMVIGTGGTRESFQNIADPLSFRRSVQEQTDAKSNTQ